MCKSCFERTRELSAAENICPLFLGDRRATGGERVSSVWWEGEQEGREELGGKEEGREEALGCNLPHIGASQSLEWTTFPPDNPMAHFFSLKTLFIHHLLIDANPIPLP